MSKKKQTKNQIETTVNPALKKALVLEETFHFLSLMTGVAAIVSMIFYTLKGGNIYIPLGFAIFCGGFTIIWRQVMKKKRVIQEQLGYKKPAAQKKAS